MTALDSMKTLDRVKLSAGIAKMALDEGRQNAAEAALNDVEFWLNELEAETAD